MRSHGTKHAQGGPLKEVMGMRGPVASKRLAWLIEHRAGHPNQQELIKQLLKHEKHLT